jgi:DNA-binding LacI/PurR family transcriptional regulator
VCFLLGNRDAMNSMQMRMLVACESVLRERGLDLVFTGMKYAAGTKSSQLALPRILREDGLVDGVILAGQHHPNLLEIFERRRMPYALAGNNFTGKPLLASRYSVHYDDRDACYEATNYLARLGHQRIGFLGNLSYPWVRRRHEGYEEALRSAGLKPLAVTEDWQVSGIEYGRLATARLLRQARRATALLAANDEVAAGAWKELINRGMRIPREMSLVGFGDREEFSILEPSLTTISVYPDKLGAELARMLLRRLDEPGVAIESKHFPCRLVERASCAPPPSGLAAAG